MLKHAPDRLFFVEMPVNLSRDVRMQLAYGFAADFLPTTYDYVAVTEGEPTASQYCIRLANALLHIGGQLSPTESIELLAVDDLGGRVESFVRAHLSQSGYEAFYDFTFKNGESAVNYVMGLEQGILSHMVDVALKEAIEKAHESK